MHLGGTNLKKLLLSKEDSFYCMIYEILHEIKLNPDNGVKIDGDFEGIFNVGGIDYIYKATEIENWEDNPYGDVGKFYNISFNELDKPNVNTRTKNQTHYIKVLSTMYRKILEFTEKYKPKYFGLSSLNKSNYHGVYDELTRTNQIPDYFVKNRGKNIEFENELGNIVPAKMIVFKRK